MKYHNTPRRVSFVVAYAEHMFKKRINEFQGGYTTVLVPGFPRQLVVSDRNGPKFIADGHSGPTFTDQFIKGLPSPGDELILEITHRDGRDQVINWGYNCYWVSSQARYAARSAQIAQRQDTHRVTPPRVSVAPPKRERKMFAAEYKSLDEISSLIVTTR